MLGCLVPCLLACLPLLLLLLPLLPPGAAVVVGPSDTYSQSLHFKIVWETLYSHASSEALANGSEISFMHLFVSAMYTHRCLHISIYIYIYIRHRALVATWSVIFLKVLVNWVSINLIS